MRAAMVLCLFILIAFDVGTAMAHRLNLFAFVEGSAISGSAYFSGGGAPTGAAVTITDPADAVLGETVTDETGGFTFQATRRIDHRITVETADGHNAAFVITAAELPNTLPGADGTSVVVPTAVSAEPPAAPRPTTAPGMDQAALEAMIGRIVQQHVRPLREQLLAYNEAVRVSDILGGIGYIAGVFGVIAYILSIRRRNADKDAATTKANAPAAAE